MDGGLWTAERAEAYAAFHHTRRLEARTDGPAQLACAYLLPVDAAPAAMHACWPVIAVPLFLFHLAHTKRHGLRA